MKVMESRQRTPQPTTLDLPETSRKLHVAFEPSCLDMTGQKPAGRLTLRLPSFPEINSAILVIDAYMLDHPVHPFGHFGWWSFELAADQEAVFTVSLRDGLLEVKTDDAPSVEAWVNDVVPEGKGDSTIALHLVLRHRVNNAILSQQSLVAYRDGKAMQAATKAVGALLPSVEPSCRSLALHGFNWPCGATAHVVVKALPEADKIAASPTALMAVRQLAQSGVPFRLYATEFDPRFRGVVYGARELLDVVRHGDIVIVFYDDFEPNLSWLQELKCRKAFVYLGIPSTSKLQAFDAEAYNNYAVARQALSAAVAFDVIAAVNDDARQGLENAFLQQRRVDAQEAKSAQEEGGVKDEEANVASFLPVVPLPLIQTGPIADRFDFWNQVQASTEKLQGVGKGPVLVCQATLDPCYDFLATLFVFEQIAALHPSAQLIAVGARAQQVYFQYITYMLATRFKPIAHRIALQTSMTDAQAKALLQKCEGFIHMGAMTSDHIQDAQYFGKPFFVSGEEAVTLNAPGEGVYRLYGTRQEQAAAVVDVLLGHGAGPGNPAPKAGLPSVKPCQGWWKLLEQLVAIPVPSQNFLGLPE